MDDFAMFLPWFWHGLGIIEPVNTCSRGAQAWPPLAGAQPWAQVGPALAPRGPSPRIHGVPRGAKIGIFIEFGPWRSRPVYEENLSFWRPAAIVVVMGRQKIIIIIIIL